ncbi:MAG: cofactor-independent phosphoglycerate mutase [Oscillospiraceae bacterium]|nr:cofactor-independent phosphoglycerate mutase [Oscillospiraceae bacterium]
MRRYAVILCDGMADRPLDVFGGKTPMAAADKPNMDRLAINGQVGRMNTLYPELPFGSDVANLSILGSDPRTCYTGRSPVEALGLGIALDDSDMVFRMNLINIGGSDVFEDCKIVDHSADKITTEEAEELVNALKEHFENDGVKIHLGVSYRHCFILKNSKNWKGDLTPPHDVLGDRVGDHMPTGDLAEEFADMMKKAWKILSEHPVNLARVEKGLRPANCLWLWGAGGKPKYVPFKDCYGVEKGMMITAVPLIMGLGAGLGLDYCTVEGATGDYYTNYEGKASAAIDAFENGYQFVFIHVEAPDECGHDGDAELKKASIEQIDRHIVGPVAEFLEKTGEPYRILITPDHATPIVVRTHTGEEIPFVLFDSEKCGEDGVHEFTEAAAIDAKLFYPDGYKLMADFIG